jgi:hypothetical protein
MMRVSRISESHRAQDTDGMTRGGDGENPFFMLFAPR